MSLDDELDRNITSKNEVCFTGNFFQKVYEILKLVPYGRVVTYGEIAKIAGNKNMSRQVGWALHVNPNPKEIPCYRVVNRKGELSSAFAFGGKNRQKELLEKEGVEVVDDRVDLTKFGFHFNSIEGLKDEN